MYLVGVFCVHPTLPINGILTPLYIQNLYAWNDVINMETESEVWRNQNIKL